MKDGLAGTLPIGEAIALAKAGGYQGLELAIAGQGVLTPQTIQTECEAIRGKIDASDLVVETLASGLSWTVNPVSDDPEIREKSLELHVAALERAAWLGCQAMLFVPGVVSGPFAQTPIRYDHALARLREIIKPLLDVADRVGVDLCMENVWNGLFYSPLELADFIDSFNSPKLGVYLDVGNLMGYHQHPPHWIEILGKRIKRVHVKDFVNSYARSGGYHFCDIGSGQLPWDDTMAGLKAIGYDSTIVCEVLPWDASLLARNSVAMDQILGRKA